MKLLKKIVINHGIIIGYALRASLRDSENPNINFQIVKENNDMRWDYWYLSKNPNITWEIVQENPDKPWNYWSLSANPNITFQIVQTNPLMHFVPTKSDMNWDYNYLSENPNITYKIVKNNPNINWNFFNLSRNTFNNRKYNWSKKLHKFYNKQIKGEILHLLWVWNGENIKKIPKDLMYIILEILY